MRYGIWFLCLLTIGCQAQAPASQSVLIKLATCLGPPSPVEGFTSAAPDCRARLNAHLAPSTPDAPVHACLFAHRDGTLKRSIPFAWKAPRFALLDDAPFTANGAGLEISFMIFREPIARCAPSLWNATCLDEPNCVFRLTGKTFTDVGHFTVDFRPPGGGRCGVEIGPFGGPACQGCSWYENDDRRPCAPTVSEARPELPEPICNVETCEWERPSCQAHCQWGPFAPCEGAEDCASSPPERPHECPCGADGKGPIACDPSKCSWTALPCLGRCRPGEEVAVRQLRPDDLFANSPEACGPCERGDNVVVCSDACEFSPPECRLPVAICEPGMSLGMEVACENELSQPGFHQPFCGDMCDAEGPVPGECLPSDACEGMGQSDPCGPCEQGMRSRDCVDGVWGPWSSCTFESPVDCTPGTEREIACEVVNGVCGDGSRRQICDETCSWGEPSECSQAPLLEIHCDGIDQDCDGADRVADEWDFVAVNGTCDVATPLTAESLGLDPGASIVVNGTNHSRWDQDHFVIDADLIPRCGDEACLDFAISPGTSRLVAVYDNPNVCNQDTRLSFALVYSNDNPEQRLSWRVTGGPVIIQFASFADEACDAAYSFTLQRAAPRSPRAEVAPQ